MLEAGAVAKVTSVFFGKAASVALRSLIPTVFVAVGLLPLVSLNQYLQERHRPRPEADQ
jgi:hypothetical protein